MAITDGASTEHSSCLDSIWASCKCAVNNFTSTAKSSWDLVSSASSACFKEVSSVANKGIKFVASTYNEHTRISQVAIGAIVLGGIGLTAYALRGYIPENVKSMFSGSPDATK